MSDWSQPITVRAGQRVRWDLGVRRIWAERRTDQWLMGQVDGTDEEVAAITVEVIDRPGELAEDGPPRQRMARAGTEGRLQLVPRPPPRPVIARSELPLAVPPGERTRVYVGVPIWAGLEDRGELLAEVPVVDLSDTWFGSYVEGTLCYATRTLLRMDLDGIQRRPWRAIVALDVHNQGADPLVLERVQLPAPSLDLYVDEDRRLWMSSVRMTRAAGQDAEVHVADRPPASASEPRRIGRARQPMSQALLGRVFNAVRLGGPL